MTKSAILGLVLVTAAVTYALRAIPITAFRHPFRNRFVAALLDTLPYTLLTAMIIPNIFYSAGDAASFPALPSLQSAAGAIVALTLGFARQSLPIVALSATLAAYLCGILQ